MDLKDDIDASAKQLGVLLESLSNLSDSISSNREDIAVHQNEYEAKLHTCLDSFTSLEENTSSVLGSATEAYKRAIEESGSAEKSFVAANTKEQEKTRRLAAFSIEASQSFEDFGKSVLEECEQLCSEAHALNVEMNSAIEELSRQVNGLDESFSALSSDADLLQQVVVQRAEAYSGSLDQMRVSIEAEFASAIRDSLLLVKTGTEELLQSILYSLSSLASAKAELVEQFGEAAQELSHQLSEHVEESVREIIEHAKLQLEDGAKDAFEEFVAEVAKELATEVVESVAISQAGVATTSAISPVLPELVAAKAALKLINAII